MKFVARCGSWLSVSVCKFAGHWWAIWKLASEEDQGVSDEDQEVTDMSQKGARLGRRLAIIEDKENPLGAVEVGEVSPCNSCDETDSVASGEGPLPRSSRSPQMISRKNPCSNKMATLLALKTKYATMHDITSHSGYKTAFEDYDNGSKDKKGKSSIFLKLKTSHKTKDSAPTHQEILEALKRTDFNENCSKFLELYKNAKWTALFKNADDLERSISNMEYKRRGAIMELFTAECKFLIDNLLVLKHCFREPLRNTIVDGLFTEVDPEQLFGNLDDLFFVSSSFCKSFEHMLLSSAENNQFVTTEDVVKVLKEHWDTSRNGDVYTTFCLSYYSQSLQYLEHLRAHSNFLIFEQWCEKDARCGRLPITSHLFTPMQHWLKMPLKIRNAKDYTADPGEKEQLEEVAKLFASSLERMEAKLHEHMLDARVRELQSQLLWPTIYEIDPKASIPEFLKPKFIRQSCENLLVSSKKRLVYEGPLFLTEVNKTVEAFLVLFEDMLLVTKIKKPPKKKLDLTRSLSNPMEPGSTDGASFVVHKQPIPLDRFNLHPIGSDQIGLKNAFFITHFNRFHHIFAVFTFQATTEAVKNVWVTHLLQAKTKYQNRFMFGFSSQASLSVDPTDNIEVTATSITSSVTTTKACVDASTSFSDEFAQCASVSPSCDIPNSKVGECSPSIFINSISDDVGNVHVTFSSPVSVAARPSRSAGSVSDCVLSCGSSPLDFYCNNSNGSRSPADDEDSDTPVRGHDSRSNGLLDLNTFQSTELEFENDYVSRGVQGLVSPSRFVGKSLPVGKHARSMGRGAKWKQSLAQFRAGESRQLSPSKPPRLTDIRENTQSRSMDTLPFN